VPSAGQWCWRVRRGHAVRSGACSPSCCSYRKDGCGAPHPPHRNVGRSPVRPCLFSQARSAGPRSFFRFAHQHGEPAMLRTPGPQRTPRLHYNPPSEASSSPTAPRDRHLIEGGESWGMTWRGVERGRRDDRGVEVRELAWASSADPPARAPKVCWHLACRPHVLAHRALRIHCFGKCWIECSLDARSLSPSGQMPLFTGRAQ
jgi:hypothetical protein